MASGTGAMLYYDPLGRLHEYDTSVSTRFYYARDVLVAEVANPSGAVLRRYVPGPGTDEPVVWYEGVGTADRRWLHSDERGSVIAVSDATGAILAINRYDEYAIPQSGNVGRFQYTGQAWLPELGLAYYKARMYSPSMGRFMQTDPIGYEDGPNWYNYVHSDPINGTDPTGLEEGGGMQTITVTASLTPIDFGRSFTISLPGGFQGPTLSGFNLSATSVAVFAQAGAVQSGIVLESRMKGERGRAGSNKGTPNPNKHMKPVPGRPGFGQIKDPQTGKLSGPKPWPDDPRLGPKNSNYAPLAIAVSGVVIVGAIILAPEITIPTLIFGGGTAALAN